MIVKLTQYSKTDIAFLNAINRRIDKINEAGGDPEKTMVIIKEIMADPEVKAAFFKEMTTEDFPPIPRKEQTYGK